MNIVHTASGEAKVNAYCVDIILRNNVTVKDIMVFDAEIGRQGIDMLIGMDIISKGDFSITYSKDCTTFSFRTPSIEEIDYVRDIRERERYLARPSLGDVM